MDKIAVCDGIKDLKQYLSNHNNLKICLYLADKTKEAWDISTSRVYMNQIDESFVYLPVNIKKGDWESIKEVYTLAENEEQIVAINQTQPHKSNPVQKEWFLGQDIPQNVDSLIKNKNNKLQCYNLNGPSFASWFEDEVTQFYNNKVIVFGVGGVGEPIARIIANKNPEKLYLVDIYSKEDLAKELSKYINVDYVDNLSKVNFDTNNKIILINCAGKEGGDDKEVKKVLERLKDRNNIFVDLRPQLDIETVNVAKQYGWNSYTGFGMNSRNDYVLLQKIQEIISISIPSFEEFAKLVTLAS
jgi:shikimate 5-dehydrogenase